MGQRIVVVGSANTDMVITVPHLPRPGETVLGGTFRSAGGGKGANQAVAAARAGGAVAFIARVGRDAFGDQGLAAWRQDGIDCAAVVRDAQAPSGVALIFVDHQAENCIAVASGANERLAGADIDAGAAAIEGAAIMLLQLEIPLPTVAHAAARARGRGAGDPQPGAGARARPRAAAPGLGPHPQRDRGRGPDRHGHRRRRRAERAANALLAQGPTMIITLGARGALVAHGTLRSLVPGSRSRRSTPWPRATSSTAPWRWPWPRAPSCSPRCASPMPPPRSRSPARARRARRRGATRSRACSASVQP